MGACPNKVWRVVKKSQNVGGLASKELVAGLKLRFAVFPLWLIKHPLAKYDSKYCNLGVLLCLLCTLIVCTLCHGRPGINGTI